MKVLRETGALSSKARIKVMQTTRKAQAVGVSAEKSSPAQPHRCIQTGKRSHRRRGENAEENHEGQLYEMCTSGLDIILRSIIFFFFFFTR